MHLAQSSHFFSFSAQQLVSNCNFLCIYFFILFFKIQIFLIKDEGKYFKREFYYFFFTLFSRNIKFIFNQKQKGRVK